MRLQDKLGEQNLLEVMMEAFDPVTDKIKKTSEKLRKILTEFSFKNIQASENLNNKLLEIMNARGILATYLMSPLSKITNPENTTQINLLKYSSSNSVIDLLIKIYNTNYFT